MGSKFRHVAIGAVVFTTALISGNAFAGQTVRLQTTYDYDLYSDPTQTTCSNSSTNISLIGPLTLNFGDLFVNVVFRQGAKRYASAASEAAVTVGPTGTIADFKKTDKIGMGNPYISLKDNQSQSNQLLQLGRCVSASNQSVWNRPRVTGNQIAFLTATLSPNACDRSKQTITIGSEYTPTSVNGTLYFSNQLLSSAPTTSGYGVAYGLTLASPPTVRKGGPIDSNAAGGNPYVSMQIADCSKDKGISGSVTCNQRRLDQLVSARNSSTPDMYFPYNTDGSPNRQFRDATAAPNTKQWVFDSNGVATNKLSDFVLHGPILTTETTPKRCNQL